MDVEGAKIIAEAITNGLDGLATAVLIGFIAQVIFRD